MAARKKSNRTASKAPAKKAPASAAARKAKAAAAARGGTRAEAKAKTKPVAGKRAEAGKATKAAEVRKDAAKARQTVAKGRSVKGQPAKSQSEKSPVRAAPPSKPVASKPAPKAEPKVRIEKAPAPAPTPAPKAVEPAVKAEVKVKPFEARAPEPVIRTEAAPAPAPKVAAAQATVKASAPAPAVRPPLATKTLKAPPPAKIMERDEQGGDQKTMKNSANKHGFKLNEFVVYPAHGVGQIVAMEEQEVAGFKLELFVISFAKDKMTLRVPMAKVTAVGMRKLSEPEGARRSLEILTGRARIKRTMWSRRAQEYEAKINSGDINAIAEVVRDLYRSEAQPEQSYSERQLYEAALDRMMREIAAVNKLSETEALKLIEAQLKKNVKRTPKADGAEGDEADIEEAA